MPEFLRKNGARSAKDGRPYLRMNQLMAATGLPKSTLLHYVNEGLLPSPVKTGRNMAYYHPDCIDRAAVTKELQTRHRLPLASIRRLLDRQKSGLGIRALVPLHDVLFGSRTGRTYDVDGFCEETGLTRRQVRDCVRSEILIPLAVGGFDEQDVAVGQVLKQFFDLGMSVADAEYYPRLARQIVDQEMALRQRWAEGLGVKDATAVTLELTRGARAMRSYVIDRIFQRRILATGSLGPQADSSKT